MSRKALYLTFAALVMLTMCQAAYGQESLLKAETKPEKTADAQVAWVAEALKQMQTIKPGMTRKNLFTVLTTEGGLSTGLRRTFVSRECPYFKVDIEFQAIGRPDRDENRRVTLVESNDDIILKVSTPYLQFGVTD